MRRLIVLRPEPGLSASAARARALGLTVIEHPLFVVQPVDWSIPDDHFDGLVLTSANAIRHGGERIDELRHLDTYAVGDATAEVARSAGLHVVAVGSGGVDGLELPEGRLLHLCGERSRPVPGDVVPVKVYRTIENGAALPAIDGAVIAVHSPAAGERLASLATRRASARVAAISAAAAQACGSGWEVIESAKDPDDSSLLALAAALCQSDGL